MTEVQLREWQSAEPKQCGSCHYMRRSGGVGGDICTLKLPPWVPYKEMDKDSESSPRSIHDQQGCDFWMAKHDAEGLPVKFSKVVKWNAGENHE